MSRTKARPRSGGYMGNPKSDFVFIDEHGDPGPIGTGSARFATCAVHVTDISLEKLVECFADMRFYRQVYAETKNLHSVALLRPKLTEMLCHMNQAHGVSFSITHLEKAAYTGLYLTAGQGTAFRNFQVRRLLEWHFSHTTLTTQQCEIVLDRHAHSAAQLNEFVRYLNRNWNLPSFAAITAVDSRYVESVQIADMALSLFRKKHLEANPGYQALNLDFINSRDVTQMNRNWKP